jgi:hypothetical protein
MPPIMMRDQSRVRSMAKESGDGDIDEYGNGGAIPLSLDANGKIDLVAASDLVWCFFCLSLFFGGCDAQYI